MIKEHVYHIYPLGYCDANQTINDGVKKTSLGEMTELIPHIESLNVTTLLLGPIFESMSHGYDTVDYQKVDRRLGTNEDLIILVKACHKAGIKVMLDCVFNHVSRQHSFFISIKNDKESSPFRHYIAGLDFNRNNGNNDGFSYDTWDGHGNLVKLNLENKALQNHLIETAIDWVKTYDIDGLRMDAADVMYKPFLAQLSNSLRLAKEGFMMLGEVVHGDYNEWLNQGALEAITNYEAYKGLYSSLNDRNYYEIAYALNRQFGSGGLYPHSSMLNFVDNHDVERVATKLKEERHLYPLYVMLYTMPGIPTLYYGSEYGVTGAKGYQTDAPLRPSWTEIVKQLDKDTKENHPLKQSISRLSAIRKDHKALVYGDYKQVYLDHGIIGYERYVHDQRIMVFVNADENLVEVPVPQLHGTFRDVLNGETVDCHGRVSVYGNWGRILVPVA